MWVANFTVAARVCDGIADIHWPVTSMNPDTLLWPFCLLLEHWESSSRTATSHL